jgi:hypothetical protein
LKLIGHLQLQCLNLLSFGFPTLLCQCGELGDEVLGGFSLHEEVVEIARKVQSSVLDIQRGKDSINRPPLPHCGIMGVIDNGVKVVAVNILGVASKEASDMSFHICREHVAVLKKNETYLRAPIHVLLLSLDNIFIFASEWLGVLRFGTRREVGVTWSVEASLAARFCMSKFCSTS